LLSACIGEDLVDDRVPPEVRITNPIISLEAGTTHQYEAKYFDFVGKEIGTGLLSKKLWVIGRLGTLQSLHNGSLNATNSEGSIFANNVEYTNIGSELIYKVSDKISLSASYTSTLSGKIIYTAPAWSGGISMQL